MAQTSAPPKVASHIHASKMMEEKFLFRIWSLSGSYVTGEMSEEQTLEWLNRHSHYSREQNQQRLEHAKQHGTSSRIHDHRRDPNGPWE